MAGDLEQALISALIAETASKADLVWVEVPDQPARALWHVWHDDAVAIVTGGREQPDPGLADGQSVQLILRSKDKQTRVVRTSATVEHVAPDSQQWEGVVKALQPKRLNAADAEHQPDRWANESDIWRLHVVGAAAETPGAMDDASLRAVPQPTDATTADWKPFHAGKATRRR
jgi:hypothetical protein